jgi:hypothetical protein
MDLNKDQSILQLIIHLKERFGSTSFMIEDNWEADLCAIGIADLKSRYLLYISSYGKPSDSFYLEFVKKDPGGKAEKVKRFESVTTQEIDQVFERYIVAQSPA